MARLKHLTTGVGALALLIGLTSSAGGEEKPSAWSWSEPQAKINYIDVSQAPKVKIYVSFLDEYLKPIPKGVGGVSLATIYREKPKKGSQEIFTIKAEDASVTYPKRKADADNPIDEDEAPTFTLLLEEESGMAIVIVMPGTAPYRNQPIGSMTKAAVGDFLKAGKNHRISLLWVGSAGGTPGQVLAYVNGQTTCVLCDYHKVRPSCEKAAREAMETAGEPPAEAKKDAPKKLNCGLSNAGKAIGDAISGQPFQGICPNLFGLGLPKNKLCRTQMGLAATANDDEQVKVTVTPAFQLALEILTKEAKAGEGRAIILIGDARDGYFDRVNNLKPVYQARCKKKHPYKRKKQWAQARKAQKACVHDLMRRAVVAEQTLFERRLQSWFSLAKAANVRIYTVANPMARPDEQDRLSVLALRTGGTYRHGDDDSTFQEMMDDLTTEVNQQYVFTFIDKEAKQGAKLAYKVKLIYDGADGSGEQLTSPYHLQIPKTPGGIGVMISNARSTLQEKLGKGGFLALMIGLALILGLLLLVILKKIFGGKAKAVGGLAKKGKKGAAGLKGAAAKYKKIKK